MISDKLRDEIFSYLDYYPETGEFRWIQNGRYSRGPKAVRAGDVAGYRHSPRGYLAVTISGRNYLLHKLAFVFMTGDWPSDIVDHINRDTTDNRWCNLRDTNYTQNLYNTKLREDNSSGRKGVYFFARTKRWAAGIRHKSKYKHLGYFGTFEEAVKARAEAEGIYHALES